MQNTCKYTRGLICDFAVFQRRRNSGRAAARRQGTGNQTELDAQASTNTEVGQDGAYPGLRAAPVMHRCAGVVPIAGPKNSTTSYHLARHVGGGASARVSPSGAVLLHLRHRHGHATSRPGSRAYFADRCDEEDLSDASSYAGLSVLGKTISFTVDLSQATCGCVVAAYLVPMRANTERGSCDDFYCDANKVR